MWVDESVSDPSLWATADYSGNRVTRRLKHFSGYLVGAGEVCDAWTSDSCAPIMSFAGYMVGF
jgi:hypothetical protein